MCFSSSASPPPQTDPVDRDAQAAQRAAQRERQRNVNAFNQAQTNIVGALTRSTGGTAGSGGTSGALNRLAGAAA